jgi:metal-responsive CopG/Arc/MetJ family transcriptional regulator
MGDISVNLPEDLVRKVSELAGDSEIEKLIEDAVRVEIRERAKIRKRIEQSLETPPKQGPPDWDKLKREYRKVPVDLPGYLVDGVDELVGERGRTHYIVHVVLKELEETEEIRKEKEESGEEFHPYWETSAMVYAWVRAGRDEWDERLEKLRND